MIQELALRGLGVIDQATCRFAPGFTAVTGETGAGKTMVVTGLGLLAGGRADPGLIRTGADQAVVEGWFDPPSGPVAERVREAGGEIDDEALTAARIVAGRARSILGGRGVPAAVLAEVAGQLIAIHGQHEQTRLGARARSLLDAFAGPQTQALAVEVARVHAQLRSVQRQVEELQSGARERARELDLLEFSLAEIEKVDPQPGEDALLAAEAERLANAEDLVGAARLAAGALSADLESEGGIDVLGLLWTAVRALESAAAHDPVLGEHASALRSVQAQAGEVAADLASYAEGIEADPRRLAHVQERIAALAGLTRKYADTADGVLVWAQQAAARVALLAGADDRIEELVDQVGALRTELAELCAALHAQRVHAAERFTAQVGAELAALAMPGAQVRFDVRTTPDPQGLTLPGFDELGPLAFRAHGVDEVELLLAANRGSPLRPIASAASGGELSRVLLALQVVLAGADPVPTMVFDEVDAGVGGAAAIEVGRRLQRLSETTQVIVVTHLAQVAAFADRQLVVTKDSDGSITASSVRVVEGEDRLRELSRMMSGIADSTSAGAHAQELLDLAMR